MTHQHYTYIVQQAYIYIYICVELYLYMQLVHTNTSWDCDPFDINSLQWWLQRQAPWMRVSATWAQRATRRTIRRMGIEMSKMCCPAVAKSCPWDLWVIGFVLNSVRSENHKTSWWTAQRHCPAPAKFCHLSTCGRQISPLRTRRRHRVLRYDGRRNDILCISLHIFTLDTGWELNSQRSGECFFMPLCLCGSKSTVDITTEWLG